MNTRMLWNACLAGIISLCTMGQVALANEALHDSEKTVPVSLNIYPVSVTIPYGAHDYVLTQEYYVVNNVNSVVELSGFEYRGLNPPKPSPVRVTRITNNCGGRLKPQKDGGSCTITVHLIAHGNPVGTVHYLNPINHEFSFLYGARKQRMTSPVAPMIFATGKKVASLARTFSFENNCSTETVWLGIASGAAPAITPDPSIHPADPQSCVIQADCYPGSTCTNVATGLNHCLWENPVPAGGATGYEMTAGGPPTTVTFDVYDNGIDQQWNGHIAARIGCTGAGASCTIADCGSTSSDGACPLGQSFATPSSAVEFTLQGIQALVTNTSGYPDNDTYDVTVINGFTGGGISMQPTNAAAWNAATPYTCGTPGGASATAPLGSCDWTASPPVTPLVGNQSDYVWIDASTGACPDVTQPNGGCTSPQVCGHTISGSTVSASVGCGTQLGLLTPDAVCAIDNSFGAPFNCSDTVTQDISYYYYQVYGCSTGEFKQSCYTKGAATTCCGCQNWDTAPDYPAVIPSTATGLTKSCGTTVNPNWISIVEPKISWVKQACPTAYVFPYDDASSTFTCQVLNASNVNTTNYKITFCPS